MTVEGGEGQRQLGNGDPVEIWAIGTGTGDWDWTWPRSTVTVTECQRALTSGQATAVQYSAGLSRDTSSTARLRWLNPQPCPIQTNPTCLSNSQPGSSVAVQALASPCFALLCPAPLCFALQRSTGGSLGDVQLNCDAGKRSGDDCTVAARRPGMTFRTKSGIDVPKSTECLYEAGQRDRLAM